jgi:hypothetical protein
MAYAAIGLVASLFVHLMSFAGARLGGNALFFGLHVGIFPLWLIVVLILMRRFGLSIRTNSWKIILHGCPAWMRWMTWGFFAYAIVNFMIFIVTASHMPKTAGTGVPPPEVWRGFSGHWMAFYSAGLAALTSAYRQGVSPRKCPAGHVVGPIDNFCPICGAKLSMPQP